MSTGSPENPGFSLEENKHFIQLDGLRGIAILLVMSGHFFYKIYIFNIGWIGLNLFFLLSGFLITSRLYHHLRQPYVRYFKNFYARRFLRIFPLYYGCLIFFFFFLPTVYKHYFLYYSGLFDLQLWYWLYASNWLYYFHGINNVAIFFHFWSLAVEEQFYLLWPVFVRVFYKYNIKAVLVGGILLSIAVRNYINSPRSYYNTAVATEPLLLGALVWCMLVENKLLKYYVYISILAFLSVLGLGLIFHNNASLGIDNMLLMNYGYSAIDILLVFLLSGSLLNVSISKPLIRILSNRLFVWAGKYSYGIYVYHWIIMQTIIPKMDELLFHQYYFLIRVFGIVLSCVVSYFSFHLWEKHFLSMKKFFP